MSKNLNCPNCGYPILQEGNKCPYCGTSYFDMSAIDFSEEKPFYLKFKTKGSNGEDVIITQFVKPKFGSITISTEYEEAKGLKKNQTLGKWANSSTATTSIEFVAIPDKENRLVIMEVEE